MKKALKIFAITIGVLLILILLAPILFKGPIEKAIKKSVNNNLTAQVNWEKLDLSLYRDFPNAHVQLKNLSIINQEPFEGDTLVAAKKIGLSMGIMQLFATGENPISITQFNADQALINIKVDSLGRANYDIAQPSQTNSTTDTNNNQALSLDIQNYSINQSIISYLDESSNILFRLEEFNHKGSGDFKNEITNLNTQTNTLISLKIDDEEYLNKNKLALDAVFKLDLANQRYSFLENEALINQLPLSFDGYFKVNEKDSEIDLSFKTPTSDFKNFLAVIPESYAKNLDQVKTTGDFSINGKIKGIINDELIPKIDIRVSSDNASFKYPDLPKGVENISITANLKNETGKLDDTYLDLEKLNFRIDQDQFAASGTFRNITSNMLVNTQLAGKINLANIEKAYPIELEQKLNGLIETDLSLAFAMNDIEKEQYERIKSKGKLLLQNFEYSSPELPNKIAIKKAGINFNPGIVNLNELALTTGKTDLNAKGKIGNLLGFLFTNQQLKGDFTIASNNFVLEDFKLSENKSVKEEEKQASPTRVNKSQDAIKIPSFLDANLNFTADNVVYDNLKLKNVNGSLSIKNEKAQLKQVKASIFGGQINLGGSVSTQADTPAFDMDIQLERIGIAESFAGLELFKQFAPIVQALEGTLTTQLKLNGALTSDFTPILSSLDGSALAQILQAQVQESKLPLLSKLNARLDFLDFTKLNLNNLTTQFEFNNGQVLVKPFELKLKDILIKAQGTHSLSNEMNYQLQIDLPAKYLGKEIAGGLASLTEHNLNETKVKLPVQIGGSFTSPKVQVETKTAVKNLSQQIIDAKKDDVINEAKDKITDLIKGNQKEKDSTDTAQESPEKTKEEQIKEKAGDLIKDIFKGKKKKNNQEN